jgi:5'(3')-deoxyribonucleotidase
MKNLESLLMQVFEYKKQLFALAREIISSINTLQSKFMKVERYLGLNIFEVQTNNRFYWNIKANPSEFIEKNLNFSSFEIISKYLKKKLSSSKIFKIS